LVTKKNPDRRKKLLGFLDLNRSDLNEQLDAHMKELSQFFAWALLIARLQ
jgi:hypothetical protein